MTILHFGAHQNDVFVPALLAALLATVLLVLPVVFAPTLRRARRGRLIVVVAAVVAAGALALAVQQTVTGLGALRTERSAVAAELRNGYGLAVTDGQVGTLLAGGEVEVGGREVALRADGGTAYTPVSGKRPIARQA